MANCRVMAYLVAIVSVCSSACSDGATPTPDLPAVQPVWTSTHQHLEMSCGSYWRGAMSFRADRDELSQEQLDLLSKLKTVEPTISCSSDTFGCQIHVTDSAGVVHDYRADEAGAHCDLPTPLVDYATVCALLETIRCKYSKQTNVTLSPDVRCENGMSGTSPIHQSLAVDSTATRYHVEIGGCSSAEQINNITMQVFAADTTTPLAVGGVPTAPVLDGACLALDVQFPAVGTADLVITTTGGFGPLCDLTLAYY